MKRFFIYWALLGGLMASAMAAESSASPGYEIKPWATNQKVPGLRATALDGQIWELSNLRGKAVLLNFWASWCEPCRAEMPSLQALQARHGEHLVVLAVNYQESPEAVQRFVQRQGWTLPVIPDPQGVLAKRWGIRIFPTSVLINGQGTPVSVVRGEVDWQAQAGASWVQSWLGKAK